MQYEQPAMALIAELRERWPEPAVDAVVRDAERYAKQLGTFVIRRSHVVMARNAYVSAHGNPAGTMEHARTARGGNTSI